MLPVHIPFINHYEIIFYKTFAIKPFQIRPFVNLGIGVGIGTETDTTNTIISSSIRPMGTKPSTLVI